MSRREPNEPNEPPQPRLPRDPQPSTKVPKLLARAVVTAALFAVVVSRLDLNALAAKTARLDATWLALAFLVVFAAIGVSAYKWGLILQWRGHALAFDRLVRHYLVGLFFNNVLPTTVGGDAVRAWETTRDTREIPEAVGSVVTERLIAGAALGVTALLGLPFVYPTARLLLLVAGFLVVDIALVALFVVPRFAERLVTTLLPRRLALVRGAAAATVAVVRQSLREPRLLLRVMALSVVFQVLVAAVNVCLFAALGVPVSLARCIVYTPMIFTVTMLPISLSGLGVREAAYAYFFSQAGLTQTDSVAVSLLFFTVVGIASLPGAALLALGRRAARADRAEVILP